MSDGANSGNRNRRRSSGALGQRELRIDESRLDQYAMAGLTVEELAATFNVSAEQLERDYRERIRRAAERGIGLLRRKAFEQAVIKNDMRVLCFLLTHVVGIDPQLKELRELEIRERRLRVERLENEEKQRAQLALELQKIEVQRRRLTLGAQQHAAAAQKAQEGTELDSLSGEELQARYNQVSLQMKLLQMDPEQRDQALEAIPEILAQPLPCVPQFRDLALLVYGLDAQVVTEILERFKPVQVLGESEVLGE